MTRITERQLSRNIVSQIIDSRRNVSRISDDISSGLQVRNPGDSNNAGTISQLRQSIEKVDGFQNRITTSQSFLAFQEDILAQASDLLIRAKEIAEQASNETNSAATRAQMSAEVFQIRDHLVSLANSTYQGRYVFGGNDEDDPPYDAATYTNPATGSASQRYVYDSDSGSTSTKSIYLTETLQIRLNTAGSQLFNNAVQGLERLGRAMAGYETLPASGSPDGTGAAYTFPSQYSTQTQAIKNALDQLDTARESDIMQERVDLAGRQRRIDTAKALLAVTKESAQTELDSLQSTDMVSAATDLSQAQTSLQASLTVSSRVLDLSIIDFL